MKNLYFGSLILTTDVHLHTLGTEDRVRFNTFIEIN